ncbi:MULTISPECIES: TraX family protein [Paenibacillus]|uniref:Conjugal transfer protein TraX n=1 Tax=Paenibacillus campinasensis TaxID=66347 RepID=A0ABW9SZ29_9BACL|nr:MULTISPECIES: TraX family protein [Paenibacillus]MUG66249.1 conjugal transfer protein TraX [Paenibacillus campinasensis]PAK54545.1 conjugal transfer protein TraX [Paenibacillus sp. 7541]
MQWIAMITMLIDHIGLVFFPDQEMWRVIGRIAFPIYVYALVQGHFHTSSRPRYMMRLAVIAVISQIPYQLALDPYGLNVVVTLFVGAVILYLLDRSESAILSVILVIAACVVMNDLPFDYGAYGLLLILIFRYASSAWLVPCHIMLNLLFWLLNNWEMQMWSVLPTVVIAYGPEFWKRLESMQVSRWVWRSFYPLHLVLIALARYIM